MTNQEKDKESKFLDEMLNQTEEKKVLREIFNKDVEIKNLELEDLRYLKDQLDQKVRKKYRYFSIASNYITGIISLVRKDFAMMALENGYEWRNKLCGDDVYNKMYVEERLFLDFLIRATELGFKYMPDSN